jgi:hypothetical protein
MEHSHKAQMMLKAFAEVRLRLEEHALTCSNFEAKVTRLVEVYRYSSQFAPIDSSIDSVARLSTKMAASRAYFEDHEHWLEDQLLSTIGYYVRLFAQVREWVEYRTALLERVPRLAAEEAKVAAGLVERAEQFDGRFLGDWEAVRTTFEEEYESLVEQLGRKWHSHCGLMSKIWK